MINCSRKRIVLTINAQSRKRHPRARGWKCWRFGGESCGKEICGVFGGQQASRNQSGWHPTLAQTWSAVVGRSSAFIVRPKIDSRCSPTQHGIVVTPPVLESCVDYLAESTVAAVPGEWRLKYLATVGYQNAEFTTDPDLFAETGNLSDSAVICA